MASPTLDAWRHPQDRANIVLTAIFKMSIRLIKFWERYHVVARGGEWTRVLSSWRERLLDLNYRMVVSKKRMDFI